MNDKDVRWKQRYHQFAKAFALLSSAVELQNPSVLERAGIIQFFEMAFELGWKLLKDYQEAEGFQIRSPRDAVKQAFQSNLIIDGHSWIQALEDRNLTTHTYNEETALEVERKIRNDYFPFLVQLHETFAAKAGS